MDFISCLYKAYMVQTIFYKHILIRMSAGLFKKNQADKSQKDFNYFSLNYLVPVFLD